MRVGLVLVMVTGNSRPSWEDVLCRCSFCLEQNGVDMK